MRANWRDLLLLMFGIAIGYAVAVMTKAGEVPFLIPARHYVVTHMVEVCVGLILVGCIIALMGGSKGAARR